MFDCGILPRVLRTSRRLWTSEQRSPHHWLQRMSMGMDGLVGVPPSLALCLCRAAIRRGYSPGRMVDVMYSSSTTVQVFGYLNQGQGVFGTNNQLLLFSASFGTRIQKMKTADVDRDGKVEFVLCVSDSTWLGVEIIKSAGDTTFASFRTLAQNIPFNQSSSSVTQMEILDINQDEKLDILV